MPPLAATRAGDGPTVVLVHGFTQTAASMAPLAERLEGRRVVAVDLPGHGGSREVRADLDETALLVAEAAGGEAFDLVGYSLGGRVALHAACRPTGQLRGVVAISASPGLRDPAARRARLERDVALAERLERDDDVAGFLEQWLRNPLFATLPRSAAALEARLENTGAGLADSLRRCSVGAQRWLGDELRAATVPVLFVCGARDDGAAAAAATLATGAPGLGLSVVPGSGHVAHLEQPDLTARLVDAALQG